MADVRDNERVSTSAWVFHLTTLGFGTVVLALLARGQWFFGDEWDPIMQRSVFGAGQKNLFQPHNEHWSTLAILVYRAHLAVFGLRTYAPLMVMFVLACALTAHLLWRFCLRVGSDPYVAAVLALAFLLYGPAGDEVVFAWNFTFIGAVACGFGILLAVAPRGPFTRRDAAVAWGLGVLAAMLSGVAITMLAVVFAALAVSRGLRVALQAVSVPIGVYAVWTLGWGREHQSLLRTRTLHEVPHSISNGITGVFDELVGARAVGTIVLLAVAVWVVWTWRSWTAPRVWSLCAAGGAVVFYVVIAVRRDPVYPLGPRTGRYLWTAFALLVPLLSLAATALAQRARVLAIGAAVVGGVVIAAQIGPLFDDAHAARDAKEAERRRLLAAVELDHRGVSTVTDILLPTTGFEGSVTIPRVRALDREGKLPHVELRPADLLEARSDLQVAVVPAADAADAPAHLVAVRDVELSDAGDGCTLVSPVGPHAALTFRGTTQGVTSASIRGPASTGFEVVLTRNGRRSRSRFVTPFVYSPFALRMAAADQAVELGNLPGVFTLCDTEIDPTLLAELDGG